MRSAISCRATVSNCSSWACKAACASAVMTTESLKPISLVLGREASPPLAVVADGHERVRDACAEHEVTRVAREHEPRGLPRHVYRRASALGQDALQELPHGGRLGNEDAESMHGGLHGRRAYTNICSLARLLRRSGFHRTHGRVFRLTPKTQGSVIGARYESHDGAHPAHDPRHDDLARLRRE